MCVHLWQFLVGLLSPWFVLCVKIPVLSLLWFCSCCLFMAVLVNVVLVILALHSLVVCLKSLGKTQKWLKSWDDFVYIEVFVLSHQAPEFISSLGYAYRPVSLHCRTVCTSTLGYSSWAPAWSKGVPADSPSPSSCAENRPPPLPHFPFSFTECPLCFPMRLCLGRLVHMSFSPVTHFCCTFWLYTQLSSFIRESLWNFVF